MTAKLAKATLNIEAKIDIETFSTQIQCGGKDQVSVIGNEQIYKLLDSGIAAARQGKDFFMSIEYGK